VCVCARERDRETYTRVCGMDGTRACAFRKIVAPVTPTLGYRLTVTLQTYGVGIATPSFPDPSSSSFTDLFILFIFDLRFFSKGNAKCGLSEDEG